MTDLESNRGRQNIMSTGRGGAGNLVRSVSRGQDAEVTPGIERGREINPREESGDRVTRSGRGGAGNIRSPSRDPAQRIEEEKESALQDRLIAENRGRQAEAPFSTGRGGAGNINRDKSKSRSRSQARDGTPRGTGRGGWGNITEERDSVDLEKEAARNKYEHDVAAKHQHDNIGKVHSSGRGGYGGMTVDGKPLTEEELSKLSLEEAEAHKKVQANGHHYTSGGRGGAGNIHLSPKSGEEERGRGEHKGPGGLFGNVMRSLSRAAQGRDKSTDGVKS